MNVETKARSSDFESCTEYLTCSVAGMATLLWWSPYGSSAWRRWGCLSHLFSPPKPLGLLFHQRYHFWPWYLIASFYDPNQNPGKCWPRQESPLRCLKLKDLLRSLQGLTFSDFSTMSNSKCSYWTLASLDLTSQIPVHTVREKSRWCFFLPSKSNPLSFRSNEKLLFMVQRALKKKHQQQQWHQHWLTIDAFQFPLLFLMLNRITETLMYESINNRA